MQNARAHFTHAAEPTMVALDRAVASPGEENGACFHLRIDDFGD
jgi:hypothetical protein